MKFKAIFFFLLVFHFLLHVECQAQDVVDYKFVEVKPIFSKCESVANVDSCSLSSLFSFVAKNLKYPLIPPNSEIQKVKIFVYFEIGTSGFVQNAKIKKGSISYLDKAALSVVRSIPKYTPGFVEGEKVVTSLIVPVIFNFQD